MKQPVEPRQILALGLGALVLTLLSGLTVAFPLPVETLAALLPFIFLVSFATTFGLYLGGGKVSLLPMTTLAAYLSLGLVPAGWVAYLGAVAYSAVRYRWGHRLSEPPFRSRFQALTVAAINAAIQALAILAAGLVYHQLGVTPPLLVLDGVHWLVILLAAVIYLAVNHLLAGAYLAAAGGDAWRHYLHLIPRLLLLEGVPMLLAPLMALTFTGLGWQPFLLFSLILVTASLITYDLDQTRNRLERRLNELAGLQAVGRALNATLDPTKLLFAIHDQVRQLMPAENFYVALYDRENDVVSFPAAYEEGRPVSWSSRRSGNGLTEQVLRTGESLLITGEVGRKLAELGLNHIGQPAGCWLGVPLLAGEQVLGVMALQSAEEGVYDLSHQAILQTIASQAAVALQNALLYARTDEALMRRVQELRQILRTIHEGILLLGPEGEVRAGNRALAVFLQVTEDAFQGQLGAVPPDGSPSLLARCGFEPGELEAACRHLLADGGMQRDDITLPGPPERPVARTLTPVYSHEGAVAGWLLVFRDLTEEHNLAQMRDEMTGMLVHDLRSPLSVIWGSVEEVQHYWDDGNRDAVPPLLQMAQSSVERMLQLINMLLDINRLESGQIILYTQPLRASELLEQTARHLEVLAQQAKITIKTEVSPDLPLLVADADHLGRVLYNLTDNAIKFTPDGGHISLWARSENGNVLLGVSDTGPGIPAGAQGQLFQKFTQLPGVRARRRGTGLGLAYCRLAVEAHGGAIWVDSEEGAGSTFTIRLPLTAQKSHPLL